VTGGKKLAAAAALAVVMAGGAHHHHGGIFAVLDSIQVSASPAEQSWVRAVLRADGLPRTTADVTSMEAWIGHETTWDSAPPDGATYTRNPLNITAGAGATGAVPGTPDVSMLPDWATSVRDTAATLANGNYPDVMAALSSGNGLCGRSFTGLHNWSAGPQAAAGQGYWNVC